MKALQEAKAQIDLCRKMRGKDMADWSRSERTLAALVDEIERAPVTTAYELLDVEAGGVVVDANDFEDGQRVRVLAAGEE